MMLVSARSKNVALATAAGLLGGLVSHFLSPLPAQAQAKVQLPQASPAPIAKELSAQRFVLANDQGVTAGILGFEVDGTPTLTLFDPAGHTIWSSKSRVVQLVK
jgi:hypothetical protein